MPELSTVIGTTAFAAVAGASARTLNDRCDDVVDPRDYGLIADGSAHALSSVYGSLGAAQAVYPFVTALTQSIDWAACQMASNVAFGAAASENADASYLNKRLRLPAGKYCFEDDTWIIRNLVGGVIEGDGKLATLIIGNNTILYFDGVWYTRISGLSLQCQTTGATAVFEIDGNVPGQPYTTRGVQGVTLQDLYIDGGNSNYAFALCRQGVNAQGSECLFLNCHLQRASVACYYQNGFNALANTFVGGNFQSYYRHGIWVVGGTIAVINTGFQSVRGYVQIENDGWDILIGEAGAYEGVLIAGCRTESLRFLRNGGAVRTAVIACVGRSALGVWHANTEYSSGVTRYIAIKVAATDGLTHLYVATTQGTTGGSTPTFTGTAGETVSDGSVVWTETSFDAVYIEYSSGSYDFASCSMELGSIHVPAKDSYIRVTADYDATPFDDIIVVDATSGPVAVTLASFLTVPYGKKITVRKCDSSANAVTVLSDRAFDTGGTYTIAGGASFSKTWVLASGVAGVDRWMGIATASP